jgi:hypothetical protein
MLLRAFSTIALAAAAVVATSSTTYADPHVSVSMHDGRVSIEATDAPLAQILNEWTRAGGPRFVNAANLSATPTTIQLANVPEKEALAILLRPASGFLAVARTGAAANLSLYDRVLIMPGAPLPTSAMPTRPSPLPLPAAAARMPNPVGAVIDANGQAMPDDQQPMPFTPRPQPQPQSQQPVTTPTQPSPVPLPSPGAPTPSGASTPGIIIQPPAANVPGSTAQPAPPSNPPTAR